MGMSGIEQLHGRCHRRSGLRQHKAAIDRASSTITVEAGGTYDDSTGYFVRPTVLSGTDPNDEVFTTEYFGPILAVHVYPDRQFDRMLTQMESASPYALTGSIISQDRSVIASVTEKAPVRGRQLLHQRQADRCGRRAAAVRRRSGIGDQRQGRLGAEPASVDLGAVDQGELRPPKTHGYPHMG